MGPGMFQQSQSICSVCHGNKEIIDPKDRCTACMGKKVVREKKLLKDNQTIRFSGEGDQEPGIEPGDIVIAIDEQPHERFHRRKADLIYSMDLSLNEALTGFRRTIKTLDDRCLLIETSPGEIIKVGDFRAIHGEAKAPEEATSNKQSERLLGNRLYSKFPRNLMKYVRLEYYGAYYGIRGNHALRNPDPMVRANIMRAGLLNWGRTLGIGRWIVPRHVDPGTQNLTARSLEQYNMDVCCLAEVRLPDSGSREINIHGVGVHFILYHSGPHDSSGRHGVAGNHFQQADLVLLALEPVNDRMTYMRLKGHFTNICTVSVFAPTSAAEQRDKEASYSQQQALVERPYPDLPIVTGDWYGCTEPDESTNSHLIGRFGLGPRYENGERLVIFADQN
ncbi:DnaJ (Hsp40), sub A, member 4 [Sparganum proliferum]